MNLAPALRNRPFAVALIPLHGSRALVRRLCQIGLVEVDTPIRGAFAELYDPERGFSVVLSDGGYQKMPAGSLLVACLCCGPSERFEVAQALGGQQ